MILLALFWFGSSIMFNGTRVGYNKVTLSEGDIVRIDLEGYIAVFLNLVPDSLVADLTSSLDMTHAFIPVGFSTFSAVGSKILIQSVNKEALVQYWLLPNATCPDVRNIGLITADKLLYIETEVNGTTCLFSDASHGPRQIAIDTEYGLPDISFYHAKGKGQSARLCIGETDTCVFKTSDPFVASFKGNTSIRMTYDTDKDTNSTRMYCSIDGIPILHNKTFEHVLPKLTKIYNTFCNKRENMLTDSVRGVAYMMLVTIFVSLLVYVLAAKCRKLQNQNVCRFIRMMYSDCL